MSKPRTERRRQGVKAYLKQSFLTSSGARPLRILSEYLEPKGRFDRYQVEDTIVFMGSARVISREEAQAEVRAAEGDGARGERARERLAMSRYYEDARELARRLTEWSKQLKDEMKKHLGLVLFGASYWDEVINFDALVRHGTINREDLEIFRRTDSVDEAFEMITQHLLAHALDERGAIL